MKTFECIKQMTFLCYLHYLHSLFNCTICVTRIGYMLSIFGSLLKKVNTYSIVKYWLIVNHFIVATANLIIYVWDTQQGAHCEDSRVRSIEKSNDLIGNRIRDFPACSIVPQPTTVSIATGHRLDDQGVGVRVPVQSRILSSPRRPDRLWSPPSLLSNGHRELSAGVKRPESEADHSPPASAEVKKMWIYTSTPPYAFMALCLLS
jgi:hypothetical protein